MSEEKKDGIWVICWFGLKGYLTRMPFMDKDDFKLEVPCIKVEEIFDYLVPTGPAPGGGLTRGIAILPLDMFSHPAPSYLDLRNGNVYTFLEDLHEDDRNMVHKLKQAALNNQAAQRAERSGIALAGQLPNVRQLRRP